MKRRKKHNKKIIIISSFIGLLICMIAVGYALEELQDNSRVEPSSELVYYIDVDYDGKDTDGVESNDKTTSKIKSGYINVEDQLPEGLTFQEFITTTDGSIGAVKRSDNTTSCSGYVVGGVDGLHYDEATRKISFQVKSLGAGCRLTVGIKTMTPTVDDPKTPEVEKRRDFYNTANAQEGMLSVNSNTVHTFIGDPDETLYTVTYEFEGDYPANAVLPPVNSYATNTKLGLENAPIVEGYTFNGWTSEDVTITNNKFTMPAKNITLRGSFTKKETFNVIYEIEGILPEGYLVPDKKEYYPNSEVKLDTLKIGDEINGYRFLGWTTTNVTVTEENDFLMPTNNVTIKGNFEEIKYTVTYKFQGNIIPENSENILPQPKQYKPGQKVKLENITEPTGYRFLGWYKEDNFEMPNEDVVIYGEWGLQNGLFEPIIKKEIIEEKPSYKKGDKVILKITITNKETFPLKDIIVEEANDKAKYIEKEGYIIQTDHLVKIKELQPNESIEIYQEYTVEEETGTILSESKIIGALADNNYYMNKEKEYKASITFKVEKEEIKQVVTIPETLDNIVKYIVTLAVGLLALILCICIYKKSKNKQ